MKTQDQVLDESCEMLAHVQLLVNLTKTQLTNLTLKELQERLEVINASVMSSHTKLSALRTTEHLESRKRDIQLLQTQPNLKLVK